MKCHTWGNLLPTKSILFRFHLSAFWYNNNSLQRGIIYFSLRWFQIKSNHFNIDLLKYPHNTASEELIHCLVSSSYIPLVSRPTRISTQNYFLINNIFSNDLQLAKQLWDVSCRLRRIGFTLLDSGYQPNDYPGLNPVLFRISHIVITLYLFSAPSC